MSFTPTVVSPCLVSRVQALGQLTGDSTAGGGSTITQQYVKNAVVGDERSYTRKLKELVFSAKMANEWSRKRC